MPRRVVIVSLIISNLALLALVLWQARTMRQSHSAEPERVPGQSGSPISSASSSSSPAQEPVSSPPADPADRIGEVGGQAGVAEGALVVTTNRPNFDWRQVESDDYQTYVKNLRAVGCPEQTVQDIVAADVRQAFAAKRAEVMAERYRDFKFWKSDTQESGARSDLEPKRRAVDEAMSGALRELLGADVSPPSTAAEWQQAALGQQLAFLSEDKRAQTQALLRRYAEVDVQVRELAWGHGTPENPDERARLLADYERKKAEMQSLLTPEEYEQVELTASWTADNLRRAMTRFEPTEEEFRQIFREWRAHDERLAGTYGRGEPDPGNAQVFANIEKLLGAERFTKYRETWWKGSAGSAR